MAQKHVWKSYPAKIFRCLFLHIFSQQSGHFSCDLKCFPFLPFFLKQWRVRRSLCEVAHSSLLRGLAFSHVNAHELKRSQHCLWDVYSQRNGNMDACTPVISLHMYWDTDKSNTCLYGSFLHVASCSHFVEYNDLSKALKSLLAVSLFSLSWTE